MQNFQSSFLILAILSLSSAYTFVPSHRSKLGLRNQKTISYKNVQEKFRTNACVSLKMVDQNVIQGAAIALAGLGAGIGLVAFTENQGERAKQRGAGLSDGMATKLTGTMMEDVEVSSVSDLSSLTSQLEQALKETGGAKEEELELTEEQKQKIKEEADDGW